MDLCGGTGSWSKPYKDAGYDVRLVTLPDNDVRSYRPPDDVYGILAAPPCTQFSRARTTAKTPRDLKGAMEIVEACLRIIWEARINGSLRFWALENPTGFLRQFLGAPAMTFRQWQFGGRFQKPTDLWGYFHQPSPTTSKEPEGISLALRDNWSHPPIPHHIRALDPSIRKQRAAVRAITPIGFAKAFKAANP